MTEMRSKPASTVSGGVPDLAPEQLPLPVRPVSPSVEPPLAALLELTHRCPLQCPYCSNPLEMDRVQAELTTEEWCRVISELAMLGALQVHFSGGEPTVRQDLVDLVRHAREVGFYTNLITSGAAITRPRFLALIDAGLDHVQLSFQDAEPNSAVRISHVPNIQEKKLAFAGWVRESGTPLTVNAVIHRQNIDHIDAMIDLAVKLHANRLEVAHVQYYGWALANRAALMPSRAQLEFVTERVMDARERYRGKLVIDYVVPDYYAHQPKACMGGWGRQFLNITPSGKVLPCHAAETIPGMTFPSVREQPLADIWAHAEAFQRFRGTDWMPEPCRGCDQREIDWGGCRCQALAITGDAAAADPACAKSSWHAAMQEIAATASDASSQTDFRYRRMAAAPKH
ncbi:pyrroloquinoline quinone biosynthesis protein PqqE [Dongia soli]|uniref:PqqA peptide cyclase n=1 Tax=Dongia soli TaxID=600628 RepID=A0ABU5EI45_9PROT|nr:pyrroloquinoline quinone biosynthesis protein PqqE [Dongia soli]MDY0885810.1 pyrroloquinoline quinone biosynthesis protein PqqE [Dongia soli]